MTASGSEAQFFERPFGEANLPAETTLMPDDNNLLRCVVTELRRSNGVGGFHRTTFAYHGKGLLSTRNWGFLGYYAQRVRDEQSGITTYRQRRLDFPHFGQVAQVHQYDNLFGGHNEILTHNYRYFSVQSLTIGSGNTVVPYMSRRLNMIRDNGVTLGAQITDTDYQFSNGLLDETVSVQRLSESVSFAGSPSLWGELPSATVGTIVRSVETTTTYTNRTANGDWLIGFVGSQQVRRFDGDVSSPVERTQSATATPYNQTNALGSLTRFPGDSRYELTTSFSYNAQGLRKGETTSGVNIDTRSNTASNFIDQRYPQTLTNALNHPITFQVDPRFGVAAQVTDANDRTTTIDYDSFGREVSRTNADNVTFTTQYDVCSLVVCESVNGVLPSYRVRTSSPITPISETYVDSLGRVLRTATESFDGSTWIYQDTYYDNRGRIDRVTQPYFVGQPMYLTQFHYDLRDRVIRTVGPDNSEVRTIIQPEAGQHQVRIVTEQDVLDAGGVWEQTQTQHSVYALTGDLIETVDAVGTADEISTSFEYDASGLMLTAQVDGNAASTTRSVYDQAGFRSTITGPNVGTVTTVYNALGELESQEDNQGQTVFFVYDLLGRRTQQTDADGTAHWYYDPVNAIGALESRTYGGFTESYSYTGDARLDTVTTTINITGFNNTYTHDYVYDAYGRVSHLTYPSGITAGYDYNTRGYISAINDDATGTALKTLQQTDAFGNVTAELYGNGVTTTRTFDVKTGQLTSLKSLGGATVQDNVYHWKSHGMLESRVSRQNLTSREETFTYDALNRLEQAQTLFDSGSPRTLQTQYDRLGNILSKTSSHAADPQVTGYQYGSTAQAGPNAVSGVTIGSNSYLLHYDANGAITHYDAANGDDRWITWNALQLPTEVLVGDSALDTTPTARDRFLYGPDGQRFYKEASWLDDTGSLRTEHTFYLGAYEDLRPAGDPDYRRIEKALLDGTVLHVTTTSHTAQVETTVEYLHRDHLGSVERVTDEAGQSLVDLGFDPFGERRKADWAGPLSESELETLLNGVNLTTNRGFTDHEHLDRTGLIHMNGRIYDPALGRFLSPDPFVPHPTFSQSWNRYSYVLNSPLSLVDPSGYTYDFKDVNPRGPLVFFAKDEIEELRRLNHLEPGGVIDIHTPAGPGSSPSLSPYALDVANRGASVADNNVGAGLRTPGFALTSVTQYHENVTTGTAQETSGFEILHSDVQVGGEPGFIYASADSPVQGYHVNLLEHELSGGHTIKLHVAKTVAFLRRRVQSDPDVSTASSFYSLSQASALINMTLNENAATVQKMMNMPGKAWATIDATFNRPTGFSILQGKRGSQKVYNVFIYLRKPAATKEGFLIYTSFPR